MTLTRRRFLATGSALAWMPVTAQAEDQVELRAQVSHQLVAPKGYPETEIWGYDGTTPGPEIRVAQGERVRRLLRNDLPQPTAVHWHGIRIDNAMDGVPGLTQPAVLPGETFAYDFVVPDAGTYWYHSHSRSSEQVERGLYGALVVEERNPPRVDVDLVLALDDWRLNTEDASLDSDFDNFHDLSHAGRLGNLITVNGRFDPVEVVRPGMRLRLRLINCANGRIFRIGLNGLEGWLMALDGMPLDAPQPVTGAFDLAPAQRADLIVDVTASTFDGADLLSIERDGGYGLVHFTVTDEAPFRRARPLDSPPRALPPNPLPDVGNPALAPLHTLTMQGGAMRGLAPSMMGGTLLQPRELAQLGRFWALNGVVDRPADPFIAAKRGEVHRIALVNDTAFPHAMHLHGHHFRELGRDGTLGPWRDTTLVAPGETRQVIFAADNPGSWLLHCHMLEHAAAGMMSWITVG